MFFAPTDFFFRFFLLFSGPEIQELGMSIIVMVMAPWIDTVKPVITHTPRWMAEAMGHGFREVG